MNDLVISNLRFTPASLEDHAEGLLGWLRFDIGNALRLDGVTLRQTIDGRLTLSYPGRRDSQGRLHHHMRPLSRDMQRAIEQSVFDLLDKEVTSR